MRKLVPLFVLTVLALRVAGARAADQDDLKRFQGEWRVEALEHDGEKAAQDKIKDARMTFKEDRFVMREDREKTFEGTIKLDPGRNPRTINSSVRGEEKKTTYGIYKFEDKDTLVICWGEGEDAKRPTEFSTRAKSGRRMITLKRDRP